ncbi:MAG: efflux RND transporter periplasmic adaptor subunit [Bacteroidota bacterium]
MSTNNIFAGKNRQLGLGAVLLFLVGLGCGYVLFHETPAPDHENHIHPEDGAVWTCSMHPNVRQHEPGDCPICGMTLTQLDQQTKDDPTLLTMTEEAIKLAQVETMVIGESQQHATSLMLSGKIQADERRAASQGAHFSGRIEKLFVSFEGEKVRKGQKIARLYSPDFINAQQELLQALKLKDKMPKLYTAARQKLSAWKLTAGQLDQIERAQSPQENIDIYADVNGVVTQRKVAVGDYVQQGEVMFALISLDRLWVVFDAYEEDLSSLQVGDPISFSTPALAGKTFQTSISFIDPVIDPQTRVAAVRAEIVNRGQLLKPEMFVKGKLQSPAAEMSQLVVPSSAVLWTGKRSVVYVKEPEASVPSFRYRAVVLGERMGNDYAVEEGLQVGDEVVSQGSFAIDAAAQLNNYSSMINGLIETGSSMPRPERMVSDTMMQSPEAFQRQLGALALDYMQVKDALVLSDPTLTQEKSRIFLEKINEPDAEMLAGEARAFWQQQQSAIRQHAQKISQIEDVEAQREQFYFLSEALIQSLKTLGVKSEGLFIQYCPMALSDQGAEWLSREEEIRNPYFGDRMLSCGTVEGEL